MEYSEFREQYEQMHPASIPKLEIELSPYPNWTRWGVFLMFLSAALLSGVHTIPVAYYGIPGGDIISEETRRLAAHSSFIAVELAILLSAFMLLVKSSMKLAYIVIGVCFFIAMVANVTSISDIYAAGDELNIGGTVVSLAFGIGMPFIALMAGKLFVHIHNTERNLENKAKELLKKACVKWDTEIKRAFDKHLKDEKKASDPRPTTVQQPSTLGQSQGASDRVRRFFEDNPNVLSDEKLGVRGIAKHLNVGHQTVSTVRNQMRGEMSKNGHSAGSNGQGDVVQ